MSIVEDKFDEWTGGLSFKEGRIKIFEKIRDIHFAVVAELFDPGKGPEGMLLGNKGFCVPKHLLMGHMFKRLGLGVRYLICTFRWDDLDVDYPQDLKVSAGAVPETYHLTCEVFLEGTWILADTTWDAGLRKAGFPVNENWDGESGTQNAVKTLTSSIHDSAPEAGTAYNENMIKYSLPEKLELSRFSGGFNKWLEAVRLRESS